MKVAAGLPEESHSVISPIAKLETFGNFFFSVNANDGLTEKAAAQKMPNSAVLPPRRRFSRSWFANLAKILQLFCFLRFATGAQTAF